VVDIACSDPRIKDVVASVDKQIKDNIGNWPGTVSSTLDKCVDKSGKRATSSEVSTSVAFDGPYAETTSSAATDGLTPTLETGSGVSGELLSSETTASNSEGLDGGEIAGIVIGCVVGVTLLVAILAIALTRSKPADVV